MRFVTPAEMQAIDRYAIETIGIPGLALMENAGRAVVDVVRARLAAGDPVCICCGSGNNGGDGFVVARHLANQQVPLDVFLVSASGKLSDDCAIQRGIVEKMGVPVHRVQSDEEVGALRDALDRAALAVDALLGTGLHGEVTGVMRPVIDAINAAGKPVVAVDIPSGLSGETGKVLGAAVRAAVTVTFQLPKTGFQPAAALDYTGEVRVVDIGIPVHLVPDAAVE